MKGYQIEEIKHREGDVMLTCTPPIMHPVLASIRYRTDEGTKWLHCMKVMEFYDFFGSEDDIHEELLSMEDENLMDSRRLEDFDGIPLDDIAAGDITIDEIEEQYKDNPAATLLKYSMRLADEWREERARPLIDAAIGRSIEELEIDRMS